MKMKHTTPEHFLCTSMRFIMGSLVPQVRSATVAERAKTSQQSNRLRIPLRRKAGNTWTSGIGSRLLGLAYRFPRACSVWLLIAQFSWAHFKFTTDANCG